MDDGRAIALAQVVLLGGADSDMWQPHVFMATHVYGEYVSLNFEVRFIPPDYLNLSCYLCQNTYDTQSPNIMHYSHDKQVHACNVCLHKNWHRLESWTPVIGL